MVSLSLLQEVTAMTSKALLLKLNELHTLVECFANSLKFISKILGFLTVGFVHYRLANWLRKPFIRIVTSLISKPEAAIVQ